MGEITILDDLELVELSIVDSPANPEAKAVIAKKGEQEPMAESKLDNSVELEKSLKKTEENYENLKKSVIEAGFTITKEGIEKKAAPETIEVEGETLVKADIPAVLLKKLEADKAALEAAAVEKADNELTKRAGDELPNFAIAEAKELVKAFGENEEVMKALKAADAVFAEAQEEVGKAAPAEVEPQEQFDTLVKAHMDTKGVNEAAAYKAVSKTDEGRVLLKEIMKKG
jgi:hypothetical protein